MHVGPDPELAESLRAQVPGELHPVPDALLDRGRALLIVLKSILGTRISVRAERLTYVVGFAFLFAFLIWVSGFDIVRVLSGGT